MAPFENHTEQANTAIAETEIDAAEARRLRNKANAARSTGPKTPEGKRRSRLNALKHGLRAEEIVLPSENPEEFEALRDAFREEWGPRSVTRATLVDSLAAGAWKLQRCRRLERKHAMERAEKELARREVETAGWVQKQFRSLGDHDGPAALEALKGCRAGVLRLISIWEDLENNIDCWDEYKITHGLLTAALGLTPNGDPGEAGPVVEASLKLLYTNKPEQLFGKSMTPLSKQGVDRAKERIAEVVEANLGALDELLAAFPEPDRAAELAALADDAMTADADELRHLQRYQGQLERCFRADVGTLLKLDRSNADEWRLSSFSLEVEEQKAADEAAQEAAEAAGPAASEAGPEAAAVAPNEATAHAPTGVRGLALAVVEANGRAVCNDRDETNAAPAPRPAAPKGRSKAR